MAHLACKVSWLASVSRDIAFVTVPSRPTGNFFNDAYTISVNTGDWCGNSGSLVNTRYAIGSVWPERAVWVGLQSSSHEHTEEIFDLVVCYMR